MAMNRTQHILNKLHSASKFQAKLNKYNEIKLGKVDDLVENIDERYAQVMSLVSEVSEFVGQALINIPELDTLQSQSESLYNDVQQAIVDIEDLGLDVPPELESAANQAKTIMEMDFYTLNNNLQAAEQILNKSF